MGKMTIKEATQKWVEEFNAIPQALIKKAYYENDNFEEVEHLTYREGDEEEGKLLYGDLPMWGTMWTFGSSLDSEWAEENTEVMREHGVDVYETDELGIFFGINGAGYDFYEAHWIPLYKARGLQWHSNI